MSLSVDGVWKAGVWATTVWDEGVWREGAAPPAVVEQTTAFALGGGGGAFMLTGAGHKRRKKDETVRLDLEAAFAVFNEAPAEDKREVAAIVAPAVVPAPPHAGPGVTALDRSVIEGRLGLMNRLLDVYERLLAAQIEDEEEDEEFMLVPH